MMTTNFSIRYSIESPTKIWRMKIYLAFTELKLSQTLEDLEVQFQRWVKFDLC